MDVLKARPDDETTFVPKAPGSFQRGACNVQKWLDGNASAEFPATPGRYHIFVNYGCGWSHQVLLVRAFRGLQSSIGVTWVGCYRTGERGTPTYGGYALDIDASGFGLTNIREVYNLADGSYGVDQLTIPVLLDKTSKRVVSNDPAQILLMLDFLADQLRGGPHDSGLLYPASSQAEIEAVNAVVFPGINNGVYCCWIGSTEEAFQEGFDLVQSALKWLEERLSKTGDFLLPGGRPTLADVRAFPHVFRLDGIYADFFLKGKGARIFGGTFPNTSAWLRRMFALPWVRSTCDLQVATRFYYSSMLPEDADAIYDKERERANMEQAWLPSREEWAAKRAEEGIQEVQVRNKLLPK